MNSFSSYYYKEQEELNELYELNEKFFKSKYASNVFRKLFGSKTRRINPKDYEDTEEVGQKGFQELIDKLATDVSNPRKESKKYFIVDMYTGKFNTKKDNHQNFPPINKINDISVYKTNKGGNIVMYAFTDDEDDPRFFIGIDDKGKRFFSDTLGMSFYNFKQRSQTGGLWQNISKGDVEAGTNKPKITVVDIDKEEFNKLTPESTNIKGEYITEEGRPLKWNKDKKIWTTQTGNKVTSFRPEDFAVTKTGKDAESGDEIAKTLQQKLDKDKATFQATKKTSKTEPNVEPEAPKEEPKVSKTEPKAPKEEPQTKPEAPKEEPKKEIAKGGELQKKLAGDLNGYPKLIKPTKSIETGWTYLLKNNGQVYVYKLKTGEYKLGYTKKAMDILVKKGIINSKDVEALA